MDARYRLPFNKRRSGRTNYKKRYQMLLSDKPRMVVRITNTQIITQVIEYSRDGDKTLAQASSGDLKAHGWKHATKNTTAAYLTGLLCAKNASNNKVKEAILDTGLHTIQKKGRIYSAVKGALDGGLVMPHDDEVLPGDDRIKGTHLKTDASKDFDKTKESILKSSPKKEKEPKAAKPKKETAKAAPAKPKTTPSKTKKE